MKEARQAIKEKRFQEFKAEFKKGWNSKKSE